MTRYRMALLVGIVLTIAACSSSSGDTTTTASGLEGEVLVSAAASLTDAFGEAETAFEDANPGVDVVLNFGSSSSLREQIIEGAPADVFASANTSNMDQVVEADAASEPQIFATNLLQIAVPEGNEAGVTGLEDFAKEDLLIGLCEKGRSVRRLCP